MNNDTIVAVSTPPGRGGVGIIRISGVNSCDIAQKLCRIEDKEKKDCFKPRVAQLSKIYDSKNNLIDSGIVLYFKAPNSFTGEDVIELQTHGAPIVLDEIIKAALDLGARVANPGEFSLRAYLNNKIDLTQAEAIADLINSNSLTQARLAVNSLQGDFAQKINALNASIIELRMYVEACIDFPEEEIDFLSDGKIVNDLDNILKRLNFIFTSAKEGAILREGVKAVIAGKPNRGKSTLINLLAKRDIAIVTDIPGTTRDIIRESVLIDDLPVHLIDTAGLRKSTDLVEIEGIKRTYNELKTADLLLLIIDISDLENIKDSFENLDGYLDPNIHVIIVLNKIDLIKNNDDLIVPAEYANQIISISAKTGAGIDSLKHKIKEVVNFHPQEGQFLARRRHLRALQEANSYLSHGRVQVNTNKAMELLADDLRIAHNKLAQITGEFSSDDLLGKIFSSFCIGK